MSVDLKVLKEQLIANGKSAEKVNKAIAYLSTADKTGVHSQQELYGLVVKYLNAGTNLDGVNVVLTGKNMALITYHGYMNKIKSNHPDVFFDVQLVREGDTTSFSKESGSVVYSHKFENPFTNGKIVGAYCVVKFGDGNESLELLNDRDFLEMKNSSRNRSTWDKWESEFWRKSVIKRACKLYFTEEVKELEAIDNEDYGIVEEDSTSEDVKAAIIAANKKK